MTLYAQQHLSPSLVEDLDVKLVDRMAGDLVLTLRTAIYGEKIGEAEKVVTFAYPANTWQMFKYQYFPQWLLDRFPVRSQLAKQVVSFKAHVMYPDMALRPPKTFGGPVGRMQFDIEGPSSITEAENDDTSASE